MGVDPSLLCLQNMCKLLDRSQLIAHYGSSSLKSYLTAADKQCLTDILTGP